jgi:hypothetical protein
MSATAAAVTIGMHPAKATAYAIRQYIAGGCGDAMSQQVVHHAAVRLDTAPPLESRRKPMNDLR